MLTIPLSKRADTPISAIRQILGQLPALNQQRKSSGQAPVINLSIGQPHLPPNPTVMRRLTSALPTDAKSWQYSPAPGRPETRQAIASLFSANYRMPFSESQVMITQGASLALMNAFLILLNPGAGEVVLTFAPYFGTYASQVRNAGGELKTIATHHNQFRPDAAALDRALRAEPRAKIVILNFPNNPSGVALTLAEARALAEVLERHPQIAIIIDDVYRDINFNQHYTILDANPSLRSRCIIIHSGAKGLVGAPDLRIGMAAANEEWIRAMSDQQLSMISGVSYVTQQALIFAVECHLAHPNNNWLRDIKREYQQNTTLVVGELAKQGFTAQRPDGAFYVFANASPLLNQPIPSSLQTKIGTEHIRDDRDIVNYFLHAAGVATVPGSGFGVDAQQGYLRISCAQDEKTLTCAMQQLGQATRLLMQRPMTPHLSTHGLLASPQSSNTCVSGQKDMMKKDDLQKVADEQRLPLDDAFVTAHRHEDPQCLAEYNRRFGIVLYRGQ